jgi:hypothetical protein
MTMDELEAYLDTLPEAELYALLDGIFLRPSQPQSPLTCVRETPRTSSVVRVSLRGVTRRLVLDEEEAGVSSCPASQHA